MRENAHAQDVRIAELRARERYDEILATTLRRHLSIWFGQDYTVSGSGIGQLWREHRLFSAYIVGTASRDARRFLADQIRYTAVRYRQAPQYIIGSAAATRIGAWLASSGGLRISPDVPQACDRILMPGNRRLRTGTWDGN